jgi:hypothetical protein
MLADACQDVTFFHEIELIHVSCRKPSANHDGSVCFCINNIVHGVCFWLNHTYLVIL